MVGKVGDKGGLLGMVVGVDEGRETTTVLLWEFKLGVTEVEITGDTEVVSELEEVLDRACGVVLSIGCAVPVGDVIETPLVVGAVTLLSVDCAVPVGEVVGALLPVGCVVPVGEVVGMALAVDAAILLSVGCAVPVDNVVGTLLPVDCRTLLSVGCAVTDEIAAEEVPTTIDSCDDGDRAGLGTALT